MITSEPFLSGNVCRGGVVNVSVSQEIGAGVCGSGTRIKPRLSDAKPPTAACKHPLQQYYPGAKRSEEKLGTLLTLKTGRRAL